MKAALKKIYSLVPLIVVAFFFQNCANKNNANTNQNVVYEGISNIDSSTLAD